MWGVRGVNCMGLLSWWVTYQWLTWISSFLYPFTVKLSIWWINHFKLSSDTTCYCCAPVLLLVAFKDYCEIRFIVATKNWKKDKLKEWSRTFKFHSIQSIFIKCSGKVWQKSFVCQSFYDRENILCQSPLSLVAFLILQGRFFNFSYPS